MFHLQKMKKLIKSATSEQLADKYGVPYKEYVQLYSNFARDFDLSMIISGSIAVSLEGRSEPRQIYCTSNEMFPYKLRMHNLHYMTKAVKNINPQVKLIAQLNHGGRQISYQQLYRNGTKKVISSKYQRVKGGFGVFPKPNRTIKQGMYIKDNFYTAAEQMQLCGFDGVQIQCAHGFLLHDCLDTGDDQFVEQVIEEILKFRSPNFIVGVKVTADSKYINFINWCCKKLDFVELTQGSYENPLQFFQNQHNKPSFSFIDQNQQLRNLGAKIIVTGGFRSKNEALEYEQQNKCDYIGLARLYCLPQYTQHVKQIQNENFKWLKRFFPLANAVPQTILYQEMLRRQARGIAQTNKKELERAGMLWWLLTLFCAIFGIIRYKTKKQKLH